MPNLRPNFAPALLAIAVGLAAPMSGTAQAQQSSAGLDRMRAFAKELLIEEQYELAVAAYLTIAQQMPDDARAQYDYAGTLGFLRMFTEAAPAIERAIALAPNNTVYWEFAAMTYQQLQQHEKAFTATSRGAQLGDINAMYALAGLHEHGRGTNASDVKALHWLEMAADRGHLSAIAAMQRVYTEGLYQQPRDAARAAEWKRRLHAESNK